MKPVLLLVDDEDTIRMFLEKTIRDEGYEALTAADGTTALEIMRRELPDLILLDGDPTRDIRLLMDAESTIDLIVKDGKIDKNIVSSPRHRIRSIR